MFWKARMHMPATIAFLRVSTVDTVMTGIMSWCVGERPSHAQTDVPPDCGAALIEHNTEKSTHVPQQPRDILALLPQSAALHDFAPGKRATPHADTERGRAPRSGMSALLALLTPEGVSSHIITTAST